MEMEHLTINPLPIGLALLTPPHLRGVGDVVGAVAALLLIGAR
jgi:hypothetical protein